MRDVSIGQSVNTTAKKEISKNGNSRKRSRKRYLIGKPKDLPIIPTGATARIHDGKTWSEKALVTEKSRMLRSYDIKTGSGGILRRNRQHLLLSKENFKSTIEVDYDVTPAHISSGYPDKSQGKSSYIC